MENNWSNTMKMDKPRMYQVSTLQALAMGHTRPVVKVAELRAHGSTGLGTFEGVDGEMIVVDGACYRATEDGTAWKAEPEMGVPFASIAKTDFSPGFDVEDIADIEKLKMVLTLKIEEDFGLNSMHIYDRGGFRSEQHAHGQDRRRIRGGPGPFRIRLPRHSCEPEGYAFGDPEILPV